MKSYTITLTSTQKLGNPDLLNHYLFIDPVYGLNFVYSATADGGNIYPHTFTKLVSGGLYFPWGYLFQTTYNFATAGPFKGPYTITFSPSGLDKRYYSILKITYDFGDGEISTVERDIVPNLAGAALLNSGDPSSVNISHDYWPKHDGVTTYIPTITVLNGNMAANIFRYRFDFYPSAIYEFDQVRLLNIAQHAQDLDETLGVLELNRPENYVTNARFFSAADKVYNLDLPDINFDIIFTPPNALSGYRSNLILNLDASDPLTIGKDGDNVVSYWKDKSPFNNDFAQGIYVNRPTFLYETQSVAGRKCVHFESSTYSRFLTCINTTGFATITSDYTSFFIMRGNEPIGTIFNCSSALSATNLADAEVSQILFYDRELNTEERKEVIKRLKTKWNI